MKEKVVYQLYPKSFFDGNGDGVGDLVGILEKIPYLKKLGVDMVWLNPFYPSPQKDNGYDITNYCEVDKKFGTMEQFEQLVMEFQQNNIDVMLDMVFNHTSIEHEWFQRALKGEKKYQDYYILRKGKENGELPTNWESKFVGKAWSKFGDTAYYYLHLYDETQADLNWRNPAVREELKKVVAFWMKKGVKGFRFDVINVIGKDEKLVDSIRDKEKELYTDKPIVHDYLQELNRTTFGKNPDIITVGEMSATTIESGILYTQPKRNELNMVFNFHHLKVDYRDGDKWTLDEFDFPKLVELLHDWGEAMSENNGWNALFWNNHDQPRALSRFCDDGEYRVESAKMLAASIHLSRGTPYIYQGEEIGMTNPYYERLAEYDDIESHNAYKRLVAEGVSSQKALQILQSKSRDNSRTPMQWNEKDYAGFSTEKPWLKVANNYPDINVEKELKEGSIFTFYQKLIALRKEYSLISEGTYERYAKENPSVYGYVRKYKGEKLLVLNNFFKKEVEVLLEEEFLKSEVLLGNYPTHTIQRKIILRPYETLALYMK